MDSKNCIKMKAHRPKLNTYTNATINGNTNTRQQHNKYTTPLYTKFQGKRPQNFHTKRHNENYERNKPK